MNWIVIAHCEAKNDGKIKHFTREIATFISPIHAEDFIEKCLPAENRDKFEIIRKEVKTMNNQEIFETLLENESKLFYAYCADRHNEELKKAHLAARSALEAFAKATGCHN